MKRTRISMSDLRLVRRPSPHLKPLCIGDRVRLNSGGPECMVVDSMVTADVTTSWRDIAGVVHEVSLPPECFSFADKSE